MILDDVVSKLAHPEKYVTADRDVPVMEMITEGNPDNPALILLGYDDEKDTYYLTVEDNDISEDYYCDNKSLADTFCDIIKDFIDKGEC